MADGISVISIYFDGRRDKTLDQEKRGNKFHQKVVTEDHYSLVLESDFHFLGHITLSSGNANTICNTLYDYFFKHSPGILADLSVIGCDGTPVNTGVTCSAIRYLEEKLNHPLQWVICLLHFNELLFRHLFEKIDGLATVHKCLLVQ